MSPPSRGPAPEEHGRARPAPAGGVRRGHRVAVAGVLAAAALAALFLLVYRRVGLDADSASYVGVARSIAAGDGVNYPYRFPGARMLDFPPLYPVLLAWARIPGVDVVRWAQVVNAVLFGVNVVLGALLVRRAGGSRGAVLTAGAVLALAPAMHVVHGTVWSEPLFIACSLVALHAVSAWVVSGSTWRLAAAVVAAGAATLARYVGVATVATIALVVLTEGRGSWARRFALAAGVGAAGLVPIALWSLDNVRVAGRTSSRELAWHPAGVDDAREALRTVGSWLVPQQVDRVLVGGVVLAAVALALAVDLARGPARSWTVRAWRAASAASPVPVVVATFTALYLLAVLVTSSTFDAATRFVERFGAPAFLMIVVLAVVGADAARREAPEPARTRVELVVRVAAAVAVAAFAVRGAAYATGDQETRLNANASAVRGSDTIAFTDALPAGTPVLTNMPGDLYLHTGRPAVGLPPKHSSASEQVNDEFDEQLAEAVADLGDDGVVVMWTASKRARWYPTVDDLLASGTLRVDRELRDGVVLVPAVR